MLDRSNLFPSEYIVSTEISNTEPSTVDGEYETFDTEYRLDNVYNITNVLHDSCIMSHDYAKKFYTYLDLDFQTLQVNYYK